MLLFCVFYIPVVNIRTVMRVVADGVVTLQSHCCLEPEVKVARQKSSNWKWISAILKDRI